MSKIQRYTYELKNSPLKRMLIRSSLFVNIKCKIKADNMSTDISPDKCIYLRNAKWIKNFVIHIQLNFIIALLKYEY